MGICEKIWSSGVSPKKASKMQLRNVDLRSVGPSVQKLWPTTFFAKKMPCILHCNAKNTISSQVSGRVQLPGVIIYIVDQKSNTPKSGGHTSTIWAYPNVGRSTTCQHLSGTHHMSSGNGKLSDSGFLQWDTRKSLKQNKAFAEDQRKFQLNALQRAFQEMALIHSFCPSLLFLSSVLLIHSLQGV